MKFTDRLFSSIVIFGSVSVLGFMLSIIHGSFFVQCEHDKYHGVHTTNFTLNGENQIITLTNSYERNVHSHVFYRVDCFAVTDFGECKYKLCTTNSIKEATFFAQQSCVVGTTYSGFISTDKNICSTSQFSKCEIESVTFYYMLFFSCVLLAITLICATIFFVIEHYNKNQTIKETININYTLVPITEEL